jgi:protein-disulfide isomerase
MNEKRNQNTLIVAVVAVVAVLAVVGIILLNGGTAPSVDSALSFSQIPQVRTEDGAFVIGNPAAPITLVEFADFTCSHCQDYEETIDQFVENFVVPGLARLEYRMIGGTSSPYREHLAQIAECAGTLKPGSFWDTHNVIFEYARAGRYEEVGQVIADLIGVSYADILDCTSSAGQFATDTNVAVSVGVQGTPAVMIRIQGGELSWMNVGGQVLNRGGIPYNILESIVQSYQ